MMERELRTSWSRSVRLAVACALLVAATPELAAAELQAPEEATATPKVDFAAQLAALEGARDPSARLAAAKELTRSGPDALPRIETRLAELRKAPSAEIAAAVGEARRSKRRGDLLEALVHVDAQGDVTERGTRDATETVALVRALASIGTTPAVRRLLEVGADHGGAFRQEVLRLLRALGDRAVPALIETRKAPALRYWAYGELEAMGKRIPADAVQTEDNQVLADVLHAYASLADPDALPVVLSFVNSDRVLVRNAAREAIATYRDDAGPKLRESYANLTGKPPKETWTTSDLARELFAAYDRYRLQEVYELLEDGLAKHKAGDIAGAVAAFDKVLARQPMLDRRGEMVPAYVAHAQGLEDEEPSLARAAYQRAAWLAPDGPRAAQVHAGLAYLDGVQLRQRGIDDPEPFRRALSLDPGHAKARGELDRLDAKQAEGDERVRGLFAASVVIVLSVVGLILFVARRRPRRTAGV
jgi:hypothetical protein